MPHAQRLHSARRKTACGVLLTTARFTRGAHDFVRGIHRPIVLIDGGELARLMIVHGVGVREGRTFAVKAMDESWFARQTPRSCPAKVRGDKL